MLTLGGCRLAEGVGQGAGGHATCGTTDVNALTLACGAHHPLAEKGWTTRKNTTGDTEWIPPPHLDHGQPRTNSFHHPETLLYEDDDP